MKGNRVCRHGVFFSQLQGPSCPCMGQTGSPNDWKHAKRMPALDFDMKAIVVEPFNLSTFKRLGQLQAEAARLFW